MTKEERDYYLRIIRHCKEISESEYKVDGNGKCQLVEINTNAIS